MKVNLTKTYEVEFAKDGAVYKKGDKVIGAEDLFNKKKDLKDIV